MKGITGEPFDEAYGKQISGKDSLVVSVFMDYTELKDKLELYLNAYKKDLYKKIGFEWVDNVKEVRDSLLAESLDFELTSAIEKRDLSRLHVAPPETIAWDQVFGFMFSGMHLSPENLDNYSINLDITDYANSIKPGINIYNKIRRDKLYGMTGDGTIFVVSNILNAIVFQTTYEENNYILCSGTWYQIDNTFFDQVNSFISTKVTYTDILLPDCSPTMSEGEYNSSVATNNSDICLFDKKLISTLYGPRQIEACDLFTKDKQFIHVKNRGKSAQLSHLFSQGKVSAECFSSDEKFRREVFEIAKCKLGEDIFDYKRKPESNEFEVIYAIIVKQGTDLVNALPFFSKVNLVITGQELERMHFKYSVKLINRR